MTTTIAARVSEEVSKAIEYVASQKNVDKSAVVRELLSSAVHQKLAELALEKYRKRQVSLGRAAELAGMPLADFMLMAQQSNVAMGYSVQMLEDDYRAAAKGK